MNRKQSIDQSESKMMSKFVVLCGFITVAYAASSDHTVLIAGGQHAKPDEAPYYVSLWYRSQSPDVDPYSPCGGAILNEQWIVTGAYCTENIEDISRLFVRAGNIFYDEPSETEQISDVALMVTHPKFEDPLGPYDLALMKLKTPLKFNKFVSPIALPPPNSVPSGSGTVMGFGSTAHMTVAVIPDVLQIVSLPIIENDKCKKIADDALEEAAEAVSLVDEYRFCAGPTESHQGHCLNDNGDPFTTKVNGKDVLVGVANFGFAADCTTPGLPSIYTRVSAFNSWIEDTINSN